MRRMYNFVNFPHPLETEKKRIMDRDVITLNLNLVIDLTNVAYFRCHAVGYVYVTDAACGA